MSSRQNRNPIPILERSRVFLLTIGGLARSLPPTNPAHEQSLKNNTRDAPPFHRQMEFEYGVLQRLQPGLRRFVCHNPGPFTFKGTNTYVLGEGEVAVVDPGPARGENVARLLSELRGEKVTHILITHAHSDHTGAVAELISRTNAQTYGRPRAEDDPARNAKGPSGSNFVTEVAFDNILSDGGRVRGDGWEVEAVHTPGHAPDHLCFRIQGQKTLLSGDHVMGWNTTVIAPPEGHMGSYIGALERLMDGDETVYYPGHGGAISEPQRFVKALVLHRRWRQGDIAEGLRSGLTTIDQLVPKIYANLQPDLAGAAALAVFAQLELMIEKGLVTTKQPGPISRHQEFVLTGLEGERLAELACPD